MFIKDGKCTGIRAVFEVGDKVPEQFGEFIYLGKEPTVRDYKYLTDNVLQQVFDRIKDSGKVWDYDGAEFIMKPKEDFDSAMFPDDKIGTLGLKMTISRILEKGEV